MIKYFVFIGLIFSSINLRAESPYSLSLDKEVILFSGGGAIAGGTYLIEKNISAPSASYINSLEKSSINAFDRSATNNYSSSIANASDIADVALALSPLVFLGDKKIQSDFLTLSVIYAETMLYAYSLPRVAKVSVKRDRPYLYNNALDIKEKMDYGSDARLSFFSNHTCIAFASAGFISKVYSDYFPDSKWQIPISLGAFTASCAVGYMRYKSGMHFPTDIIVGAAVGSAIGYLIPCIHQNGKSGALSIAPIIGTNYSGVALSYKIDFIQF